MLFIIIPAGLKNKQTANFAFVPQFTELPEKSEKTLAIVS